jgi:hypothetical protein
MHEGLDLETVIDLLYAPVCFRLVMGHEPLDEGLATRIVSEVIDGIRRRWLYEYSAWGAEVGASTVDYRAPRDSVESCGARTVRSRPCCLAW